MGDSSSLKDPSDGGGVMGELVAALRANDPDLLSVGSTGSSKTLESLR